MTKTTIRAVSDRNVKIAFDDSVTGERIEMDIWAPMPADGASTYVRYNGDRQLCVGLNGSGSTLMYRDGTKLVDLVRREYRAMRRAEQREAR